VPAKKGFCFGNCCYLCSPISNLEPNFTFLGTLADSPRSASDSNSTHLSSGTDLFSSTIPFFRRLECLIVNLLLFVFFL